MSAFRFCAAALVMTATLLGCVLFDGDPAGNCHANYGSWSESTHTCSYPHYDPTPYTPESDAGAANSQDADASEIDGAPDGGIDTATQDADADGG